MGREATCQLKWGDQFATCKVLLEPPELIVRGELRRRVPISSLSNVSADGEELLFRVGHDPVAMTLGVSLAARWAKAIATTAVSLASKLGIKSTTRVLLIGTTVDPDLLAAISVGTGDSSGPIDLILACVSTLVELELSLKRLGPEPIWIIYPKGSGHEIKESLVRERLRDRGYVDTKVASVSAKLTALRFQQRASGALLETADNRALRDLAGIGKSLEADLMSLGISSVSQLAECDGLDLYNRLCSSTGERQDPCVLDVFRCAVAQARPVPIRAEQRNWWWWSRERKAGRLAS